MAETNSQIAVTQNDETYCDTPSVNVNFENAGIIYSILLKS